MHACRGSFARVHIAGWVDETLENWFNTWSLGAWPRVHLKSDGWLPERPNGADCKSAGLRLRRFESFTAHFDEPRAQARGFSLETDALWRARDGARAKKREAVSRTRPPEGKKVKLANAHRRRAQFDSATRSRTIAWWRRGNVCRPPKDWDGEHEGRAERSGQDAIVMNRARSRKGIYPIKSHKIQGFYPRRLSP